MATTGDTGVDWPAWVQAVGSVVAILVAIGLAWVQFAISQRDKRRRNDAYLTAAIATANFAAYTIDQVSNTLGKMQVVRREQAQMTSIHAMVEACEIALATFPLHEAPSGVTAQSLLDVLQQARHVRGRVEAFISSESTAMRADFSQAADFAWKAVEALKAEQKRLV